MEELREALREVKARADEEGWAPETLHSTMAIAARHFVNGGPVPAEQALEVLAEESGVPLQEVPGFPGLRMWPPAQGETWLGWARNGWEPDALQHLSGDERARLCPCPPRPEWRREAWERVHGGHLHANGGAGFPRPSEESTRQALGCVHGRPVGRPCPHCMGVGGRGTPDAREGQE